jgi:hypothetical protein
MHISPEEWPYEYIRNLTQPTRGHQIHIRHYVFLPLLILKLSQTPHAMSSGRIIPKFQEFNENPSKCSAWLKDKGRCCQRKIAAVDQKKKDTLLRSVSGNRIYRGDEAEELADLFFCNGWHRPGGKYAIPNPERQKVLQSLFPSTPQPATWFIQAPRHRESPISSPANAAQDSASFGFSDAERLTLSMAQSDEQYPSATSEPFATRTQRELPTPSPANAAQEITSLGLSDAERLSFSNAESSMQYPMPITNPLATRGQESVAPAQAPIPVRQSARLRGAEPTTPTPDNQSTSITPSRSAVQTRQAAGAQFAPSLLPARRFAQAPRNRVDPRSDRIVDVNEECPICTDPLRSPDDVARCNNCCNDFHINCVDAWFSSPIRTAHCGSW